jgi:release factor glutamine methyltransferase
MRIMPLPGVFRPHSDTWMLAEVIAGDADLRGSAVLDLCTGSGALAVVAARSGAASVTAVDVSRRSALAVRLNAALNAVTLRVVRGDLLAPVRGQRFDLIVSNPPYVPSSAMRPPARGRTRAWEAGLDGRAILDRIVAHSPAYLRPGGSLLLVQSSVCGERRTLEALETVGLAPAVLERRRGPLGPLLSGRVAHLRRLSLIAEDGEEEELLVIRGVKPRARQAPR